ncbi:family 43 glycosylhydrolase [Nonomuraea sp. K274]|uniref:Family 43 glycosylhydrolase n=1 Tax=Nonomuraea cypriaca TaxID=1187855 RepID=A0A931AI36_9ACTN|nr:glycoside hydrolase family 43 protein [Nonomuraea cypriaca]MBF8192075.1 family 43 glycosylhydrolase [Nonomuraea cypriaca]
MRVPVHRLFAAALALVAVFAAPPGAMAAGSFPNPLFTWGGTADPGTIYTDGRYYVAATSGVDSTGGVMPVRVSVDRHSWSNSGHVFESGKLPGWSDSSYGYWAPEIYFFHSIGQYVAYFAAINTATGKRCIGRATSSTPYNFTDLGRPLLCHPTAAYSIIDPSIFFDSVTGRHYLLYKDDPNPSEGTKQIVIRPINDDGLSGIGTPYHIVAPARSWEGVSVEAPTMVYQGGFYWIFYSGATYNRDTYALGVARSTSPTGTFTKDPSGGPILSGNNDPRYCGVGHQDIEHTAADGWLVFYHAYLSQSGESCTGGRYLMMDVLYWDRSGGWPRIHDGTPSE